ncbi:MAG: hypothetical protein JKY67_05520, partial [Pseudomonadales bacterium]|nr:hypothetical protein [Pseudomonadales bacterium]
TVSASTMRLLTFICAFIAVLSSPALALPINIEVHRYLLATQKHINNKNYSAAETYLTKMKDLRSPDDIEMPNEYFYYYGVISQNGQRFDEALQHYEKYIAKTGTDGEFYKQTLQAITDTEETQSRQESNALKAAEQKVKRTDMIGQLSQAKLSQNNEYDTKIKNLYLSEKIESALVLHINSLLTTYPFNGKRIKSSTPQNAIIYTVKINNSNDIITQRQDNTSEHPLISTSRYPIYGANPFIAHKCDAMTARCEIRTPDGKNFWVEIAYEKEAAEEVAYAFSRLIKALQRSN